MKYFLRILVTILIVGAVGIGVYFLFFNEPKNDEVFTKLSHLIDDKENSAITTILDDLSDFETLPESEISKAKLLNSLDQPIDVDGGSIYSFRAIEQVLDKALNNYYVYTQVAKDVSSKSYKKIKSSINSYDKSYQKLIIKLEDIKKYNQEYNDEQDESLKSSMRYELITKYNNISLYYKETLTKEAELVLNLKSFVNKHCFDNNFYTDSKIALLDLIMVDTIGACNKTAETEIGYFINLKQSIDIYFKCEHGQDIYATSGVSESEFLNNVEKLFKNYREGLNTVFNYTHAQRKGVVDGSFVADLKVEYVNYVKNILKVLGY